MQNFRLMSIKKLIAAGRFSHIIVSDLCDVEYLSGFRSSNACCVVSGRSNLLFTDFRYREAARAFCKQNRSWKFIEIKENDYGFLRKSLGKGSVAGFQSAVLTVDQFARLKRACPATRFARLPDSFDDIFVPKTEQEIEHMRYAASIGDRVFSEMVRRAKLGITEQELAAFCEERCKRYGSSRPSFETIILFGKRAALPHGVPSDAKLASGDWVLCDFGCTVAGFASDMTRTFVFGKASFRQKKIYTTVLAAQECALRKVASGIRTSDVDKCARDRISADGYGSMFGHATGHGVGLRVHENPRLSRTDTSILQPGDVVTIEPGVYHPTFGGVRIEDMVVVRKDFGEVLTLSPKGLIETGTP
jgi:Xaa-Pro aminopeptidase